MCRPKQSHTHPAGPPLAVIVLITGIISTGLWSIYKTFISVIISVFTMISISIRQLNAVLSLLQHIWAPWIIFHSLISVYPAIIILE